jgi:hypothetical protein
MTIPYNCTTAVTLGICLSAGKDVSLAELRYFTAMQNDSSDEDWISFWLSSLIWTTIECRCLSSRGGRDGQPIISEWMALLERNTRSTRKQLTRQLFLVGVLRTVGPARKRPIGQKLNDSCLS